MYMAEISPYKQTNKSVVIFARLWLIYVKSEKQMIFQLGIGEIILMIPNPVDCFYFCM